MKRIGTVLLSLVLALLLLPAGFSFAEGEEPAAEPAVPDEIGLVGTWMVVQGGGYVYDRSTLTFFFDRMHGGAQLTAFDRILTMTVSEATLDNGVISVPAIAAMAEEEDNWTLTIEYQLEDAPECDPVVWDEVFAGWVNMADNTPLYTEEMVNVYYEQDTKDRLVLHITGTDRSDEDAPAEIDVTLVLVKVLPVFFDSLDLYHLNGTWKDRYGDVVTFVWSEDDLLDGSLDEIQLTDARGITYTDSFGSLSSYVENGQILFSKIMTFESEGSGGITYSITNMTYDGCQIVLTMEDGEALVLTPAA